MNVFCLGEKIEKERKKKRGGAGGRQYKPDIKNWFVMILVYFNYT
ncbi:hypothetical protein [Candidatus Nitrosocosmicus sp. R]